MTEVALKDILISRQQLLKKITRNLVGLKRNKERNFKVIKITIEIACGLFQIERLRLDTENSCLHITFISV